MENSKMNLKIKKMGIIREDYVFLSVWGKRIVH